MRPVIDRVETFPLEYILPDGGYGASRVRLPARTATLVKVTTSEGVSGWGEAWGPPRLVAPFLADLASYVVGQPLDVREAAWLGRLQQGYHLTTGGLHVTALSGVDIALWDALARSYGVPVSWLLGGQLRDVVPAYASTGYYTASGDPGQFRDQIASAVDEGFTAAKIKIGTGPADDVQRTATTRELLGDDGLVMVDYNGNATVDTLLRSLRRVRDLDPYWVEEPLPPEDIDGWRMIRSEGVTTAAGEALYTRFGFRDAIAQRRMDIVQPDLTKCGGFTEAKLICQMATAWNLRVSPHCWGTGLHQAAALQLIASLPDAPFGMAGAEPVMLEFDRGVNPLREGVLIEPIRADDGMVRVPSGAGIGVEIDEDAVRRLALADCAVNIGGKP